MSSPPTSSPADSASTTTVTNPEQRPETVSTASPLDAHARHSLSTSVFVEIIGTLVNEFDIIDILTRLAAHCVELLDVDAAGVLLADDNGHLRVVGASSEQVQLLELFQIQNEQGPCLDCYRTGRAVTAVDLSTASPWPQFAARSVAAGYPCVYAIPLRLNAVTLGCLNLFISHPHPLTATDTALAQALADLASIAIVQHHQSFQTGETTSVAHMHRTLDSRIAIEQAKGMIAEHEAIDMHDAFVMIRSYAHHTDCRLTDVSKDLVAGRLDIRDITTQTGSSQPDLDAKLPFSTRTIVEVRRRVVYISGELDLATRDACLQACLSDDYSHIDIDVSGVTFMDCVGYGSLITARHAIERQGGTLTITNWTGQPARLFALLVTIAQTSEAE